MATYYVDFESGNDANAGTSYALRKKNMTGISVAAGDEVRVKETTAPVSTGINATFTNLSTAVSLASSITANINLCNSSWTAATNVTASTTTTRKEGTNASSLAVATAFTTGKIGYIASSTGDLSPYNKISFWIQSSLGLAAGVLQVKVCSDATGDVAVHTATVPALSASSWCAVTIDFGSAMTSSAATVALYATSDPGTPTIIIDNIIACNTLTHTTIIGLQNGATTLRDWYHVASINGTSVLIGMAGAGAGSALLTEYVGTTTTATLYVRETVNAISQFVLTGSGTASNLITISGGWDSATMTSRTGLTCIRNDNSGSAILTGARAYLKIDGFIGCGHSSSFTIGANGGQITNCAAVGSSAGVLISNNNPLTDYLVSAFSTSQTTTPVKFTVSNSGASYGRFSDIRCISPFTAVFLLNNSGSVTGAQSMCCFELDGLTVYNLLSSSSVISAQSSNVGYYVGRLRNVFIRNSACYLINFASSLTPGCRVEVFGLDQSGMTALVNMSIGGTGPAFSNLDVSIVNCPTVPATVVSSPQAYYARNRLRLQATQTDQRIYLDTGVIASDTSTRHTASGISWKHTPGSIHTTSLPMVQEVRPFVVSAGTLVTVSVYVRTSASTVSARLRCVGQVIGGVTSDLTATSSAASIGAWELLTITFTPSEAGPVQLWFESFGTGTGDAYFDDASVTQV